ncbi:MAG: sugar kinase [Melioribacteraceae bacterium]|nr:MAG: sugar kinase [Melioribacteraceae bacterium]
MSLLVVGSIALDDVETPKAKVEGALGGSNTFISIAASYFTKPIHMVGVVGEDFPKEHIDLFNKYDINLEGLQIIKGGKTFRWGGVYLENFIDRDTNYTDLNVFENFNPVIPESQKKSKVVLLGNIDPVLQLNVLEQIENPELVICDTMNLWINIRNQELKEVINKIDVLIINDSEAKMLADENNLIKAAKMILKTGPKYLIIKKGEHGAMLFHNEDIFSAPAFPIEELHDPTGAGDTFAGGFAGYLLKTGDITYENMKTAVVYGSVLASFSVEQFSTGGIEDLTEGKINERFEAFKKMAQF